MKVTKGFAERREEIYNDNRSIQVELSNGLTFRLQEVCGELEVSKQNNASDTLSITPHTSNMVWMR